MTLAARFLVDLRDAGRSRCGASVGAGVGGGAVGCAPALRSERRGGMVVRVTVGNLLCGAGR
jgi:hypothetical protein